MVPEAGVEPARPEGHRPLKTARLPVPPLRLPMGGGANFPVPAPITHWTASATLNGLHRWWPRAESNRRHPGFQPGALPPELPGLAGTKEPLQPSRKENIPKREKKVNPFKPF